VEIGHQDARGEGLGGLESSGLRWGPRRYLINTVVNRWDPKCKKYFKLRICQFLTNASNPATELVHYEVRNLTDQRINFRVSLLNLLIT
jgi:hypothetical protein